MKDSERRRLLSKLQRRSGTIGGDIPDELTVQGETVDVKAFLFECDDLDGIPESERERLESLKRALKRERLQRKQRLERESLSVAEGEAIVREVRGIDRAVNALEGLDEPDIEEQLRRKQLADAEELRALMDLAAN
jgi:tRNA pseudouridine-54 N-methylase